MEPHQTLGWRETLDRPVGEARQLLGEMVSEAGRTLRELGSATDSARESLEQSIAANPIKAVGLSFAAGVFLGWLIKRR
jgi:ElaB/YqjD/DUF883 family membrane-anchored ribosome-binding protein